MKDDEEIIFKIITVGDSGVGKTSILRRYVFNTFDPDNMSTLGVNFSFKLIELKKGKKIKLKLIDTAGQERYRSLSQSYLKNADAALFVFGFNNESSFEHINEWVKLFKNTHSSVDKIPKYIIGNKNDLDNKKISRESINNLIKETGYKFKSVSALSNNNIDELFQELSETLYINYKPKNQKTLTLKKGKQSRKKCVVCENPEFL